MFISDVWLHDILVGRNGLVLYIQVLIFNYNKDTKGDEIGFSVRDFYLSQNGLSTRMGLAALENGFELGLYGYNHMSLTLAKPMYYESTPYR